MNEMDIIDIEEENEKFQNEYLQSDESKNTIPYSDGSSADGRKFVEYNVSEEISIPPIYFGKFLKDTVRNDVRV